MRFVKLGIISIIVFFTLITCIGLLIPSSVTVIRIQNIYAPVDSVRKLTNNLSNWKYWINNADSGYYKQLTKTTAGINSKIKLGTYTITVLKDDTLSLNTKWHNENVGDQFSSLWVYRDQTSDSTTVSWNFSQHLKWYPWERLGGMLHDKILGPLMETSLLNLKQLAEKDQINSNKTE